MPSKEHEPSADQLAAVSQLVDSGNPPYVDFSLFGPRNKRFMRRLMYSGYVVSASGEWARKELPGPGSFAERW